MKYLFLVFFLIMGCSGLDKKDCSTLDWFKQGEIDGMVGKRKSYFVQHSLTCIAKPNKKEYIKGRAKGLVQFCTLLGGFKDGLKGQIYIGQCKNSTKRSLFFKGRAKGKEIYSQKEKVSELKEKLKDTERDFKHNFNDSSEMSQFNNDLIILKGEIKLESKFLNELQLKAAKKGYLK